jgi:hypothetical protein
MTFSTKSGFQTRSFQIRGPKFLSPKNREFGGISVLKLYNKTIYEELIRLKGL